MQIQTDSSKTTVVDPRMKSPLNEADAESKPSQRLKSVALLIALAAVALNFLTSTAGFAYSLGSAVGALVLPVIVSAAIGWGNDRRAHYAFCVVVVAYTMMRVVLQ